MIRATQQQLVDCIRQYQRANTLEAMKAADAVAAKLVGVPHDAADKPAPAPRAKATTPRKTRK